MAKFFASVWLAEDSIYLGEDQEKTNFPLVEFVQILDEPHITVVTNWMKDPFFP